MVLRPTFVSEISYQFPFPFVILQIFDELSKSKLTSKIYSLLGFCASASYNYFFPFISFFKFSGLL